MRYPATCGALMASVGLGRIPLPRASRKLDLPHGLALTNDAGRNVTASNTMRRHFYDAMAAQVDLEGLLVGMCPTLHTAWLCYTFRPASVILPRMDAVCLNFVYEVHLPELRGSWCRPVPGVPAVKSLAKLPIATSTCANRCPYMCRPCCMARIWRVSQPFSLRTNRPMIALAMSHLCIRHAGKHVTQGLQQDSLFRFDAGGRASARLHKLDVPVRAIVVPFSDQKVATALAGAVTRRLAPALPPGTLWLQDSALLHATLWHASRHLVRLLAHGRDTRRFTKFL